MNHPRLVPVLLFLLSTAAAAQGVFSGSTPPYKSPPRIVAIDPQDAEPGKTITVFISPGERTFSIKEPAELRFRIQELVVPAQKISVNGNQIVAEITLPPTIPYNKAILISALFGNSTTEPFPYRTGAPQPHTRSQTSTVWQLAADWSILGLGVLSGAATIVVSFLYRRQLRQREVERQEAFDRSRALEKQLRDEQLLQVALQERLKEQAFLHNKAAQTTIPPEAEDQGANLSQPVRTAPLTIPNELIEACASGNCVLFAGGGLSIRAGYPTWHSLLNTLIDRTTTEASTGLRNSLHEALRRGSQSLVAEVLRNQASDATLLQVIREIYSTPNTPLPPEHQTLSRIGFSSIITNTWDTLLERAINDSTNRQVVLVTPQTAEQAVQTYRNDPLYIAKIFGDPLKSDHFVFGRDDFQAALYEHPSLSKLLTSIVLSKTILFIGAASETIAQFFAALGLPHEHSESKHYAFIPKPSSTEEELRCQILARKHGIEFLFFAPTSISRLPEDFITSLSSAVERRRHTVRNTIRDERLQRLRLHNIGPFHDLELSFNENWTVLLGNNGCGKSTLLKAVALGLCGGNVKALNAGQRLLSASANEGVIELIAGGHSYTTELRREGNHVRVFSKQLTPLETGNWVTLGFPSLRGVSGQEPAGPSAEASPIPTVEDLLPLIEGVVDRRLDNLKQWIVNENARMPSEAALSPKLKTFFSLLSELSPGINFQFARVDRSSWQVLVRTPDGEIPLDSLSQGMSSVFGWVGTLIERMSAIHGTDQPQDKSALLLIDELDAHLHPAWQQKIVSLLKKHFPRLQIIATTHSPLIIAGLKAEEVFIVQRTDDPGNVYIRPATQDPRGMRADQILTSPFFGLSRTRNKEDIDRYVALARKQLGRTPEEEAEYQRLRQLLELSSSAETATEKRVEQAVTKVFNDLLPNGSTDEKILPEVELEVKRQLGRIFSPPEDKP